MAQMLIRIDKKMDDALKELAKEREATGAKNYVEDTPEGVILNGVIEQWEPAVYQVKAVSFKALMTDLEELIQKIIEWGNAKGINNPAKQFNKLAEEMLEAHEACIDYMDRPNGYFAKERYSHLIEELGDIGVVWLLLCNMLGVDHYEALSAAHSKNRYRKGKTINGDFIKDSDLGGKE